MPSHSIETYDYSLCSFYFLFFIFSTSCKEKQVSETEVLNAPWNGEPTCKRIPIYFESAIRVFLKRRIMILIVLRSQRWCRERSCTATIQNIQIHNEWQHCFITIWLHGFGFFSNSSLNGVLVSHTVCKMQCTFLGSWMNQKSHMFPNVSYQNFQHLMNIWSESEFQCM